MGQQSEKEGAQHTYLEGACTACSLPVKNSNSQLHGEVLSPIWSSLWVSCCGMIVLNAELKSMNSILT